MKEARNNTPPVFTLDKEAILRTENTLETMINSLNIVVNDTNESSSVFFTEETITNLKNSIETNKKFNPKN